MGRPLDFAAARKSSGTAGLIHNASGMGVCVAVGGAGTVVTGRAVGVDETHPERIIENRRSREIFFIYIPKEKYEVHTPRTYIFASLSACEYQFTVNFAFVYDFNAASSTVTPNPWPSGTLIVESELSENLSKVISRL